MRSNYKRIGSYVKQVNNRNKDLSVTNIQGININKEFMPSVANTNGTDLSKYKVVSHKQFAFNPMHVGRDEVLPISMLDDEESVIVSPAYVVFKVKDENELLPEYLMMWCRRPEFDRNAWFTTDSSVRGGFGWEDFCDLTLPVPSIEKQREIVKEYHTITDRIKLNEQLNQKLEETAQAIYKQWFVDFEFPISKKYALEIGKPELEGNPYRSSGGEMVYKDELDQEIPKEWEKYTLSQLINIKHGFAFKGEYFSENENENILLSPGNFKIGGGFKLEKTRFYLGEVPQDYIFQSGDLAVTMTDLSKAADTLGYPCLIPYIKNKNLLHNQRLGKSEFIADFSYKHFLFQMMCSPKYRNEIVGGATGTTVKHTSPTKIMQFSFAKPLTDKLIVDFDKLIGIIHNYIELLMIENIELAAIQELLNSKMTKIEATA